MEITVSEHGTIELRKVFNSIKLVTEDGETMFICMRDSGFEFMYEGEDYSAKEGEVKPIVNTPQDQEDPNEVLDCPRPSKTIT